MLFRSSMSSALRRMMVRRNPIASSSSSSSSSSFSQQKSIRTFATPTTSSSALSSAAAAAAASKKKKASSPTPHKQRTEIDPRYGADVEEPLLMTDASSRLLSPEQLEARRIAQIEAEIDAKYGVGAKTPMRPDFERDPNNYKHSPVSLFAYNRPVFARILDYLGFLKQYYLEELTRAVFIESTRKELYDRKYYAVADKFNDYVSLVTMHTWLVHMQLLRREFPRKFRSDMFEVIWQDYTWRMEHEEGVLPSFVQKNVLTCQENTYSSMIFYELAYRHHLNNNPQPLINALHWNIFHGNTSVDKSKLIAMYAYVVEQVKHFDTFADVEFKVGRVVYNDVSFPKALQIAEENNRYNWDGRLEEDDTETTFADMVKNLMDALPEELQPKRVGFFSQVMGSSTSTASK